MKISHTQKLQIQNNTMNMLHAITPEHAQIAMMLRFLVHGRDSYILDVLLMMMEM